MSNAFTVFIGVQWKVKHITDAPPIAKDPTYDDWFAFDCGVISWLVNNMEPNIVLDVLFLTSAKMIWDMLKETYDHEKNISCVFKIYEKFFSLQQGDRSVQEFYTSLRSLMDELDTH